MYSSVQRFLLCALTILFCSRLAVGSDLESAKRAYAQKDFATAVKEFTAVAEAGNAEAQLIIGKMYMIGQGVPKDAGQAIKWFKAAAGQGDADAQFFLGAMYLLPKTDLAEGVRWLRLSAAQGNQDAQYLLGKTYLQGTPDLPRDPVQGAMWLRLAAKENKQFYLDDLNAAEKQMTQEQIAKAQALAAEWKPTTAEAEPAKKQ